MMKPDRYVPPGFNWRRELKSICMGLSAAVLYSLQFFLHYDYYKNMLYYYREDRIRTLYEGAQMVDFHVVVGGSFAAFAVMALCLIPAVVLHYAYHYQGTKSIYLMRRLPSRRELHIRCFAMPLAAILAGVLIVMILLLIFYWVYIALTPDVCLTPNQWGKLWNAWLGV